MNKRILSALVLSAILLSSIMVGLASAGKGQTKQSFELILVGAATPGANGHYWITEDKILQARDYDFAETSVQVTVGGVIKTVKAYSAVVDLSLDMITKDGTIRVRETITFDDDSTLELRVSEDVFDYKMPTYHTIGTFNGYGTGSLEGVQVVGTSSASPAGITRVGITMGWPQ